MMLVLKEGRQVAFGTAKDMLEAVRRLQAVPTGAEPAAGEGAQPTAEVVPPESTPPTAVGGAA